MPTELPKRHEPDPEDLERYGHWQHVLMLVGLVLLAAVIATWLWGG
jgi:hypothetical protein